MKCFNFCNDSLSIRYFNDKNRSDLHLYLPLVKSVISIIIIHICFANTMTSLPLSSHLETSWSNNRFSVLNTSTYNENNKNVAKLNQYFRNQLIFPFKCREKISKWTNLFCNFSSVRLRHFLHSLSGIRNSRYFRILVDHFSSGRI